MKDAINFDVKLKTDLNKDKDPAVPTRIEPYDALKLGESKEKILEK